MDELHGNGRRRMFAFSSSNLGSMRIVAIWLIGFVSATSSAVSREPQGSNEETERPSTFRIDRDEPIILSGKVEGERVSFVLDTGASFCALNSDLQSLLQPNGSVIQALTPNGVLKIRLFKAPQIEIETTPPILFQSNEPIACLDLRDVKEVLRVSQIGLLGVDFFKTHVVHLNFDEGIGSFPISPVLKEGHVERLHWVKQAPAVLIRLPSEGFTKFSIDTGYEGSSLRLESPLFEQLLKKKKIVGTGDAKSASVGSTRSRRLGCIDCLEFGPHRFFNVSVAEGTQSAIGLSFLRRFEVELDLPNKQARFRPGLRIDEADSHIRAGMSAKRVQGKWLACDVLPMSDAAKSGIVDGDEIESINGVLADDLTMRKIAFHFSRPGSQVQITLKRNNATKEAVFGLPNDPAPFPAKTSHELIEMTDDFDN